MATPRQIHLCEIVEATVSGDRATLYAVSDTGRRKLGEVRRVGATGSARRRWARAATPTRSRAVTMCCFLARPSASARPLHSCS